MEPDREDVRRDLRAELEREGRAPAAALFEGYVTLVMGMLRRAAGHPGMDGTWRSQAVAWLVQCAVRIPHPDETKRLPVHGPAIRSLFRQAHEPVPDDEIIDLLADVAAYAAHRRLAPLPCYLVFADREVAEAYRSGTAP